MLCNEHARHDQEDKQDSESLHCRSRWLRPQVMLRVTEMVLMTVLLFVTWVTRSSFMLTQPLPVTSDPSSSLWRLAGNGRVQLIVTDSWLTSVHCPVTGWRGYRGGRGIPRVFYVSKNSHSFTSFYHETNNYEWNLPRVLSCTSCRLLLATYYSIFWDHIV